MAIDDLTRTITHTFQDYDLPNQNAAYNKTDTSIVVHKEIVLDVKSTAHRDAKTKTDVTNDEFMTFPTSGTIVPFWGAGLSVVFTLIILLSENRSLSNAERVLALLGGSLSILFVTYLITKPKKELILNRLDEIITFPGFYWQKNITMEFKDIIFVYSTGGDDAMGAFQLEILRPHKSFFNSTESLDFGGGCYESMSFITWYMDKNRPLPPGTAFDPYRQKDFERRKAEGFPKPLYPATIETPEATMEQQAERERVGGW